MSRPAGVSAAMPTPPAGGASQLFTATDLTRRKLRNQRIAKWVFGTMGAAIVAPLLAILGYIFVRALPALSWNFITGLPENGMRCWPPRPSASWPAST